MLLVVFPEMFWNRCGTIGPIVSGRGIQLPEMVYSDACRHLLIREILLHQALQIDDWDCVYAITGCTRTSRYPWHIRFNLRREAANYVGGITPH